MLNVLEKKNEAYEPHAVSEMPLDLMRSFKLPSAEVTLFFGVKEPKEFYFHELNREIDNTKIENLVSSMLKDGFYPYQPIVANEDGMIVDGQHRLLASIKAGVPAHISVYPNLSTESIIATNTMRTNWSISDFVHYFAVKGYYSFQVLMKLSKKYKISPVTVQQVIKRMITSGRLTKELKNGTFMCTKEEVAQADKFLEMVTPILRSIRHCNVNRCIAGLTRVGSIVGSDSCYSRIQRNIENHPDKVYKCTTTENYVTMFIDMYNIGLSDRKKIKLYYR